MTSLCPGPVFMSPGFNQHSTPTPPTATPSEIDLKLRRQPFCNGREWPKDSPVARVYDVSNTSTSLILLNKRLKKKSHLRGLTEKSGEIAAPDPERHLSDEPTINWQYHEQCFNYQPELYKPLRATLDRSWIVNTPRPFTVDSQVNPKRHASCWSSGNDHHGGRWGPPPRRPGTSASLAVDSELQSLSPVLNDPDLTPGERRYLYSIARIYSTAQMKVLKQGQYFDLLYRELRKGYHTEKEIERYYNYLNIPRKTQIGRLNNYEEQKRAASAPLPRTSSQNTSERSGSPQRSRFPQYSSGRSWTSSSRFSSAASSRRSHDKHSSRSREGARSRMGHSRSPPPKSSQKEEQQEAGGDVPATDEIKNDKCQVEIKDATSPIERTRKKSSSSQSSSLSSASSKKSGDSHRNSGETTRKMSGEVQRTQSPERRPSPQGEEADSKKDRRSPHEEKDTTSSKRNGRSPHEGKDLAENAEEFPQEGAVTMTLKGKESPEDGDGGSKEKDPPMSPSQNKDSESPDTSDTTDSSTSEPESDRSDVASKDQAGTGNNQTKTLLELIVNDAEEQQGSDKDRQEQSQSSSDEDSSSTTSSSSKNSRRSKSSSSSKDSNRPKSSSSAKEPDRPRDFSNNNLASGYTTPHHKEGVDRPVSRAGRENESRQKEEETSDEESGETESDEDSVGDEDMTENRNTLQAQENPTQEELLAHEDKLSQSSKGHHSQQARMGNVDSTNEITDHKYEAEGSHPTEDQSEIFPVTSSQAAEKDALDLSVEGRNSDVDRLEY